MRNRIRRGMATSGLVLGGLLTAASPAIAAPALTSAPSASIAQAIQAQPTRAGGDFHICLHSASNVCLVSNGVGNQVTISSNPNDYSNWHIVRSQSDGNSGTDYQWANGNGNCLREGTGNVVKLQNGSCDSGTIDNWWDKGGALVSWNLGVRNLSSGNDYMLTHGTTTGFNVWAINSPGSGDYWRWNT